MKMQQLAQRMFFPMLVSFSLSGIGVLLMYIVGKKNKERIDKTKKKNEAPDLDDDRFGDYFRECLVHSRMIPAIIGRNGKEINRIESTTNTRIFFREEIDCATGNRIVVVSGEPNSVEIAIREIEDIIKSEPKIEVYEYMIPVRTIKNLLKNNANLLKRIQSTTFAKIIFDRNMITHEMDNGALKPVTIKGKDKHIEWALIELEKQVRFDEVDEQQSEKNAGNRARRVKPPQCLSPDQIPYGTDNSHNNGGMSEVVEGKDLGKPYEVFVCYSSTPTNFFIQIISEKNRKLDALVREMTTYYKNEYNRKGHELKKIDYKQIVAVKHKDGKWYRGMVIHLSSRTEVGVTFCDFGDCAAISYDDVCELSTEFLRLRFQAIEVSLYGVKPDGKENLWSKAAREKFASLAAAGQWIPRTAVNRAWKTNTSVVRNTFAAEHKKEANPTPVIELFEKRGDQFISINKELIKLKLAVEDEEAWNKIQANTTLKKNVTEQPRYSGRGSETSNEVPARYGSPFRKTSLQDLRDLGREQEDIDSGEDSDTPDWQKRYPEVQTDSSIYTDDDSDALETENTQRNENRSDCAMQEKNVVEESKVVANGTKEGENGHVPEQNIEISTSQPKKIADKPSGNHVENVKSQDDGPFTKVAVNPFKQTNVKKPKNIMPAGFESDSEDSDGFDLF